MQLKPGAWNILLLALLLFTNIKTALASDKEPQVQWSSPSAGDQYGPGDTILPQSGAGTCSEDQSNDETCGSKVYPTVQQPSSSTYSTSLVVPNATTKQGWYMAMSDDFDNAWSDEGSNIASAADAQAPLSAPPQTATSTSPVVAVPVTALPVPVAEPDSASSAAATSMLTTRTRPPTAAFAVPLSIVGAILLYPESPASPAALNRDLAGSRISSMLKETSRPCRCLYSCQLRFLFSERTRRSTKEAYHAKQYTEYYRPKQRRHQDSRPPSYRSAPVPSPSRSQSRTRSLLSSVSSRSQASSRTAVHPSSHYHEGCRQSDRSYRPSSPSSSHRLPPLRVGSPLQCSEYEYPSEERRERYRPSRSRYDTYREDADADCATNSPAPTPRTFPPGLPKPPQHLPNPPRCLIPAPQRLHVRNSGAVSPRSQGIIEEEEEEEDLEMGMKEVDFLNKARRY
ncbi:hypothetical protein BT96DRAFT_921630 [Gymnopus androsaceus JB14]|uniref:Uncharacterized protein n=1 Tax=Gymnopus androsaceus JB14 TaxID=1447944 RepID=A0A6A4HH46_9AGAR|nr:hypothetical protein BT96DRAFT_921630 [Gymnopus androsaceus JB14]